MKSTMLHRPDRPDLRLPSQPPGIIVHWLVPNYTACRQRHMCVNSLPRVALDSGSAGIRTLDYTIASPAPYHWEGGGRIVRGMKLCVVRVTGTVRRASKDCVNWALLNPATEELRTQAKTVADLSFTGDLAYETGPYRPETEEGEVVSVHCRR